MTRFYAASDRRERIFGWVGHTTGIIATLGFMRLWFRRAPEFDAYFN